MANSTQNIDQLAGKSKGNLGAEKVLYYYIIATAMLANLIACICMVRSIIRHFSQLLDLGIQTFLLTFLGVLFLLLFGIALPISGQFIMHDWKITRKNYANADQIIGDTKMMLVRGLIMKACIIPIGLAVLILNGSILAEVSSGIPVLSASDSMFSLQSFGRLLIRQFATSFSAFYAIFQLTSCKKLRKGEGIINAVLMLIPILDLITLIHLFIVNRRDLEVGKKDMTVDNMLSGTRKPGMIETVSGYIFVSFIIIFAVTGFVLTIALK